ncbi:uncharacterized protein LOC109818146 [Cajanus cajan]|uniref:uncharacterized protein LOC109818146 n=1 Tax=Cajanus cajan TaxID=3821 RepID=UPI00098D83FA|nr:uncharacterized protein LOC109818146 [Cajanus cajan]
MKEAKLGIDPSLSEFYFRTHQKKDHSWVGPHAEFAYDKFQQRKIEISSQNSRDDGADSQSSMDHMPSDLDIWVDVVGKKKGRIPGLGSVGRTLITSSRFSSNFEDDGALRSQIQALNESLQRQEQEKLEMRQELYKQQEDKLEMRRELTETRKQLAALMQHLGFVGSCSHSPLSTQHNNESDDEDDEDNGDEYSNHIKGNC